MGGTERDRRYGRRAPVVFGCLSAFVLFATSLPARGEDTTGYVDLPDAHIYYETHGSGRPLVLLHGGLNTIESSFSAQIAEFSKNHKVVGLEQVGHGHSPDTRAKFSYGRMAEDTADVLGHLGISSADVVGWSDGGTVGLILARRHPSLVRRLVVSGAAVRADGMGEAALKRVRELSLDDLTKRMAPYKDAYVRATPDGAAHWPVVVGKAREMWLTPVVLESQDLAKIEVQTLVVSGDRDFVTLEHTLQIVRALPNAQLFVLPGTGHATFQTAAERLNPVILAFLEAP